MTGLFPHDLSGIEQDFPALSSASFTPAELSLHLRDQLRFQSIILSNVQDSVIVSDLEGKVIYWNDGATALFGYNEVEMLGRSLEVIYPELEQATLAEDLANILQEQFYMGEWKGRRKDGAIIWIDVKTTLLRDRNGQVIGFIGISRDITEKKRLEEELRQASAAFERRKDDFIIHVSHELRTPLTALNGYLELLYMHDSKLDSNHRLALLSKAMRRGEELTTLVNDILDALRSSLEEDRQQREAIALNLIVQETLESLDPRKRQAYNFHVTIPEQTVVLVNRQYVHHVFSNLLSNIFKYVPEETAIVIAADRWISQDDTEVDEQVCVSIQDAGPGIPPEELPQLFHRFARLERDANGSKQGSGLGLYICKQLVEKMGGRIWAESTGRPGEGSRFCFTLPVAPSQGL
ncbi:MAG TPA: ATP-binding protein [Ktedonobacteraceae bacterium]|nr:ATP-binding protein [Ktedonobacteraceae bacterium]